jgi:hypothetical protein
VLCDKMVNITLSTIDSENQYKAVTRIG